MDAPLLIYNAGILWSVAAWALRDFSGKCHACLQMHLLLLACMRWSDLEWEEFLTTSLYHCGYYITNFLVSYASDLMSAQLERQCMSSKVVAIELAIAQGIGFL